MCLLGFVSDLYSFGDLEEIQRHLFPVSRDGFKYNSELNGLKKIICLRKSEVYVKKKFLLSLKNCWSMAYIVCHSPI